MSDEIKRKILSTINKYLATKKVLLFGSRSRNENRMDSDYDLLIISADELSAGEKIQLSTSIRKDLAEELIDADIFVKSQSDIEEYRDKIGSIISTAWKTGIAL